ncbi:MAG: ChaN family lipoprotein, partial [Nitrospinota bacterium]|nr:ChaN family lipoprotein [Nitrospinota bacterium]
AEQMIDTVSGSRVIYVGETHDNLEAHRVQLEIIRRLQEKFPGRISVGMEMFRRSAQDDLDRWHQKNLTDKQFRKLFRKNWGRGYGLYQPIFDYLQENSIPLIGLKSSRATEQKFRDDGPNQKGLPEIDTEDVYHREYSMSLFGGNDTHTGVVSKPYQMLLLWEESMAETVADFLKNKANANRKLVVLAGGFHVQYGYGIPKRAFRRVPHAYSIILPEVTEIPKELKDREMKMKSVSIPLYASDFSWKVAYIVPPPNRIRLGVFLEELENGLKVLKVEKDSNAERMTLQKDDVLLMLEGNELTDVEDLAARLQKHNFGDTVRLTIERDNSKQEVSGILREAPKTE